MVKNITKLKNPYQSFFIFVSVFLFHKESSLILFPNNFLFLLNTLFWGHTSFDALKVKLVCLYICPKLPVSTMNVPSFLEYLTLPSRDSLSII